jgi:hypothetical protein
MHANYTSVDFAFVARTDFYGWCMAQKLSMPANFPSNSILARPGEDLLIRNVRMVEYYQKLVRQNLGGKRGCYTKVGIAFGVSRQAATAVIKREISKT